MLNSLKEQSMPLIKKMSLKGVKKRTKKITCIVGVTSKAAVLLHSTVQTFVLSAYNGTSYCKELTYHAPDG